MLEQKRPQINIISYGQCGEDVILNRIFGGRKKGFYVDIGAGHPTIGSITKNLADLGWQGIDIEPNPKMCALLKMERKNSHIFCGAVLDYLGITRFEEKTDWARSRTGKVGKETHCDTLEGYLLKGKAPRGFELLKIDVEGNERKVLEGIDLRKWQPEVILVETEHCRGIKEVIISGGYQACLWDGINQFFVRNDLKKQIKKASHGVTPKDKSIPFLWTQYLSEASKRILFGKQGFRR